MGQSQRLRNARSRRVANPSLSVSSLLAKDMRRMPCESWSKSCRLRGGDADCLSCWMEIFSPLTADEADWSDAASVDAARPNPNLNFIVG